MARELYLVQLQLLLLVVVLQRRHPPAAPDKPSPHSFQSPSLCRPPCLLVHTLPHPMLPNPVLSMQVAAEPGASVAVEGGLSGRVTSSTTTPTGQNFALAFIGTESGAKPAISAGEVLR